MISKFRTPPIYCAMSHVLHNFLLCLLVQITDMICMRKTKILLGANMLNFKCAWVSLYHFNGFLSALKNSYGMLIVNSFSLLV